MVLKGRGDGAVGLTAGWGRCDRRSFLAGAAWALGGLAGQGVGYAGVWGPERTGTYRPDPVVMLTADRLSAMIHAREIRCVDLMTKYLDHIEHVNPRVNAIVSLQPREDLLRQAAERDAQLAAGSSMGWMHGFPHAVKDLAATRGIRTTDGSPLRDGIPTEDAPFVKRIRENGAILIGKTNAPEFGLGSQTYNPVFGATGDAYDPQKTAGGSSGGAASALALRMVPVADGSDMMGSLRNPAAFNNVYGFRPSVDVRAVGGKAGRIATTGPMARTVADLARLLSVMADPAHPEPFRLQGGGQGFQPGMLDRDLKGVRLGWLSSLGLPMESGVLELCERSLKTFTALGCEVRPAFLDFPMAKAWRSWLVLRETNELAGIGPLYRDPTKRPLLKPEARWEVEEGMKCSAKDIDEALADRAAYYEAAEKLFGSFDYLLLPSAQVFPFAKTTHWPASVAGVPMATYHQWMTIAIPPSLWGTPTLSVPVGFSRSGLPMGMQLIGRTYDDLGVLQVGFRYDKATRWPERRVPRWE